MFNSNFLRGKSRTGFAPALHTYFCEPSACCQNPLILQTRRESPVSLIWAITVDVLPIAHGNFAHAAFFVVEIQQRDSGKTTHTSCTCLRNFSPESAVVANCMGICLQGNLPASQICTRWFVFMYWDVGHCRLSMRACH